MEIYVDGNRTSSENSMRAQAASVEELPVLSDEQKLAAAKYGESDEAYARRLLAIEFGRKDQGKKAEHAAQLIERLTPRKIPGLRVDSVWVKALQGKYRFDLDLNGEHALIVVSEDLIDELLETGSRVAEEQIARAIDFSLPASWIARAS